MYGSVEGGLDSPTMDSKEKESSAMNGRNEPETDPATSVKKRPLTVPLVFATASAVIGSSLQFGYNTGVINNPKLVIQGFFNETEERRSGNAMPDDKNDFLFATAVAIFAAGGMVGSLVAGPLADRFGRKGTLLLNNFIALAAALLMGLSKVAWSYEMLIIGRTIVGLNCGINTGIVPMYLSEVSPFNLRGAISVMNQLGVTIGILLSQILGLPVLLGTDDLWSVCLGFAAVPAVFQLLSLPFCPESPRYLLIIKDKQKNAEKALVWLRRDTQITDEIAEMRREHAEEQKEERISVLQLFKRSSLRRPLFISVIMQLSQQLSGITAVLYYSSLIFVAAGVSEDNAKYATLSTGAVMVIMTIVSVPLMDRSGRRLLHLVGLGIMAVSAALLTIFLFVKETWSPASYISVVCVMFFTLGFAIGPGSIPWLIVAELFSQGPRPAAISIAFCVNWTANFAVGLLFPILQKALQNYVFIIFIVLLVIFFVFTFFFVPETKNKSFEEISALFKDKKDHYQAEEAGNLDGSPDGNVNGSDGIKYSALKSDDL
ncbi:solute carrier family 2, facilitated glucose transporter member 3-like [Patiria miniata]|uniref:Major facilitator superfamily (MFS) profile domain-containing protein n=1 Tax=Patiria miniata TaxID=46514 RepID=A0A914BFY9_PATMI|nr:solute carrier family 2, facilitated glucose transporter member 3-like [Patiria miniata]XP_038075173.1 solute carrier family 2, facilitated glucose transporter member 3-like [Patiria miniata]